METVFWHDYETFGANPAIDRPAQFAGIRTDIELNVLGEEVTWYNRPFDDYLPNPEACLITGITPQEARSHGVRESLFAQNIHSQFSAPQTCVAGYNSIRFDDEVSRHLFFRNFYDPYEREWKNGNSRWDLIDVVRMTHALRPEGIHWPVGEDGQTTFRLEKLSHVNGLIHEKAHDAMSDVYATIELARLIKTAQPKLYDYAFSMRTKQALKARFGVELAEMKPILHVSSKFPVTLGCIALVAPLFVHPENPNGVVTWDLRYDPRMLLSESVDTLRRLLYTPAAELGVAEQRPAFKTIHLNKCPMLVSASTLKTLSAERLHAWQLDTRVMQQNLDWLQQNRAALLSLTGIFEADAASKAEAQDPELTLYSGGFFSTADKSMMARVRAAKPDQLVLDNFTFDDPRLQELLFRYKARNYPEALTEEEQGRWLAHCQTRLLVPRAERNKAPIEQYLEELHRLAQQREGDRRAQSILMDLQLYAESIVPFD